MNISKENAHNLYQKKGMANIDSKFVAFLKKNDPILANILLQSRNNKKHLSSLELLNISPLLEVFIRQLFNQEKVNNKFNDIIEIIKFKIKFIRKQALINYPTLSSLTLNIQQIKQELQKYLPLNFNQVQFIKWVKKSLEQKNNNIILAEQYAAWAIFSTEGQKIHKNDIIFQKPLLFDQEFQQKTIYNNSTYSIHKNYSIPRHSLKQSDPTIPFDFALEQSHYCIHCHKQKKDYCRTGHPKSTIKKGCPLGQKISEMNLLYSQGLPLGALAVAMIDNPLIAATGDRICHDCMDSCIFQKQKPVDIPKIETRILEDTLNLSWGVEIYSLLSRWNPLKTIDFLPKVKTNKSVLVVGSGPSGFALTYYLLHLGYKILMIDGLKIQEFTKEYKSIRKEKIIPIIHRNKIEYLPSDFGGICEYGITARWNKQYLKIIRLILERNPRFTMLGGVRFGSNLQYHQCKSFSHISLCCGAGKPKRLILEENKPEGVFYGVDFLMHLHSQKLFSNKKNTFQIRLPIIVIGGGLTAIDTATEALAYYPHYVKNFAQFYKQLCNKIGKERLENYWNHEEKIQAKEYLLHHTKFAQEQEKAKIEKRDPNIREIINKYGGITLIYHKELKQSSAYNTHPQEILLSIQKGLNIQDNTSIIAYEKDTNNYLQGIQVKKQNTIFPIPAKTLLIAIGTEKHKSTLEDLPKTITLPTISHLGDMTDEFQGSVVKAIRSAQIQAPKIHEKLLSIQSISYLDIKNKLTAHITNVKKYNNFFHITVKSEYAVNNYKAGQFFKLQNHENTSTPLALMPVYIDKNNGLAKFIINSYAYTKILSNDKSNKKIYFTGPLGQHITIPQNQTTLFLSKDISALHFQPIEEKKTKNINHITLQNSSNHFDFAKKSSIIVTKNQNDFKKHLSFFKNTKNIFIFGEKYFINSVLHLLKELNIDSYPFSKTHILYQVPMQCMMKGICGQCIQQEGEKSFFACQYHIQNLQTIGFKNPITLNKKQNLIKKMNDLSDNNS